jgi:hypothetical protein
VESNPVAEEVATITIQVEAVAATIAPAGMAANGSLKVHLAAMAKRLDSVVWLCLLTVIQSG